MFSKLSWEDSLMQQGLTATGQMHSEVISSINYQCLGPGTRHGGGVG